jgi:hypothetical protein
MEDSWEEDTLWLMGRSTYRPYNSLRQTVSHLQAQAAIASIDACSVRSLCMQDVIKEAMLANIPCSNAIDLTFFVVSFRSHAAAIDDYCLRIQFGN